MKYKVGDKVRIKSLDWYNENKNEFGDVKCSLNCSLTKAMSIHCGSILTVENLVDGGIYWMEENQFNWADEMIEGLVEEAPKYKIGDFVRVYGYESDVRICDIKWDGSKYVYQAFFANGEEWLCEDDIVVEEEILIERVDDKGLPFNEWLSYKGAFHVPNGYELKDENGNVINATKIVLEKKTNKNMTLLSGKSSGRLL